MIKKLIIATLVLSAGSVQAQGITAAEYQHMQSLSQCAYIANTMQPGALPVERVAALYDNAVKLYVKDTAAMRGGMYNPAPLELASDYAIFYQQAVSDMREH